MSEKKQDDIFSPEPYHVEYIDKDQGVIDQDAVFGEITEEGPNYRNVRASSNNMRYYSELTIPLVLCAIAVITTWSDYIVGVFKLRHRERPYAAPQEGVWVSDYKLIASPSFTQAITAVSSIVFAYAAKYLFIRILQGSRHLTANTTIHWATWLGCTSGIAIIAYIIASAIPVFNDLVSLVGALLGTLMSFQPMGCMWLYDNWSKGKISKSPKWIFMVFWSGFVILSGTFLMVGGTYGSVVSIIDSYKKSGGPAAWSCADNSNSV
ncbi:unnamed protein product [Aspergillus oryzae]|nr:unnamed protein product [Aspergillus oryzae]